MFMKPDYIIGVLVFPLEINKIHFRIASMVARNQLFRTPERQSKQLSVGWTR